eukprot:gene7092-14426_t
MPSRVAITALIPVILALISFPTSSTSKGIIEVAILIPIASVDVVTTEYGAYKAATFAPLFIDNKLRYCQHQAITCIIARANPLKFQRSARFMKVYWIMRILRKRYRYVLVMDLDTLFTRSYQPLEAKEILPNGRYVAIANDFSSKDEVNTGVMILRRHEATSAMFRDLWHQNSGFDNISTANGLHVMSSDQMSLRKLLIKFPHYKRMLMNISREVYNAFPIMEGPWTQMGLPQGDQINASFIIHFAGVFGGANMDTGHPDPLYTLLSLLTACTNHARFLSTEGNPNHTTKQGSGEGSGDGSTTTTTSSISMLSVDRGSSSSGKQLSRCFGWIWTIGTGNDTGNGS